MAEYVSRHHEWWTDERNVELVALVQAKLGVAEIAERAGRTIGAIEAQCVKLLPPDLRISKSTSVERLRELLDFPGYDWRASVRERARRARQIYWDTHMNDILRQGWQQQRSTQVLSAATEASEIEVARQLMRLGLAENTIEVADHLGCDPAGTLAGRVRLAQDRAASAVWVLIVDGALGGATFDRPPRAEDSFTRHVSVHVDYDEADLVLNQLVLDHVDAGGTVGEITAHIAERTVGELTTGTERQIPAPAVPLDPVPDFRPPSPDHAFPRPVAAAAPETRAGRFKRLLRRAPRA
ncbi:hypothetical protein [Nocardia brasiliensis]|uniref:hypothetical protein n=1 Tax=Nocardia brasiliensis TaxID=37326 RepID=UPI0018941DBA|nr:hypothetical protein [Nocardia brasiliensis]MBF6548891.1 hypothetical protein [Nocardia brasiliensis]